MQTRVLQVDPSHPDPVALAEAARVIRAGGRVAFPTETVYGLGADALDERAVAGIFEAKGRPSYNPLIVHVSGVEMAEGLAEWSEAARRLAGRFWPGPLTLVLPKKEVVPDLVSAGLPSVGLRMPAHPVARALIEAAGRPLAAPSANRFMAVSPTEGRHVLKGLEGRIEMLLDAGPTQVGIESTVLDMTEAQPVLLRPGGIPPTALESIVGPLGTAEATAGHEARRAPGMLDRHYSPEARLLLLEGMDHLVDVAKKHLAAGERVGVLAHETVPLSHPRLVTVPLPLDAEVYARELYRRLHELDEAGSQLILVQDLPEAPEWLGVRDRLLRAAG